MHKVRPHLRLAAMTAAATVAVSSASYAVDRLWLPLTSSSNWHTASNWSPNGVPGVGDNLFIQNGGSVTLSAHTAAVNRIDLLSNTRIFTRDFTLNVTNGSSAGSMTIAAPSGFSRLTLSSGGNAKAASIDNLTLNSGGAVDVTGNFLEVNNRMTINAGGQLVGFGSVSLLGAGSTSAYTTLVNNGVIGAVSGTLRIVNAGSNRLDLDGTSETGLLLVAPSSRILIEGLWNDTFSGELRSTGNGSFTSVQPWAANGSINLSGQNDRITGGTLTLSGNMSVGTFQNQTNFNSSIDAPFVLNSGTVLVQSGGINSTATLTFNNVVRLNGGTLTGLDNRLVFSDQLIVSGNATIDSSITPVFNAFAVNNPDVHIQPGARLTIGSSPGSVQTSLLIEGGTLSVGGGGWNFGGFLNLRDGGRLTGTPLTLTSGGMQIQGSGASFVDADLNVGTVTSVLIASTASAVFNGSVTNRGNINGRSIFNGSITVQSGGVNPPRFAGPEATMNGVTSFPNFVEVDMSELTLLRIAGAAGSNATFTTTGRLNSREVHIGAGASSTGRAILAVPQFQTGFWSVAGSMFVGGNASGPVGTGTLQLAAGNSGTLDVSDTIRLWPGGRLDMQSGRVFTTNLLTSGGSMTFTGGSINLNGGTMTFPTDTFGFAGPSAASPPTLNLLAGSDASFVTALNIANSAGSFAVVNVSGLGAGSVPTTLRNTGTGESADLVVGSLGTGSLNVTGGGRVTIVDDLVLGNGAGSAGSLTINGVVSGVRSTLTAEGRGLDSAIVVGSSGLGSMLINSGARVSTSGDLFVAQSPTGAGGIGVGTVSGGFAAELAVGNNAWIGGSTSAVGGQGIVGIGTSGRFTAGRATIWNGSLLAINGGTVSLDSVNRTAGGILSLSSGTLLLNAGSSGFGNASFTIGDGTSATARMRVGSGANTLQLPDLRLAANGRLEIFGGQVTAGTLTHTADTVIDVRNGGTLSINQFATGAGTLLLDAARVSVGSTTIGGQPVTLNAGGGSFSVASLRSLTLSGNITGNGELTKVGLGTLILTGNNTYSGGTTHTQGVLNVNTDSMPGPVVNSATLRFDQAFNGAHAGGISGTGSLTKAGAGVLTLNGTNTYANITNVVQGTLRIGSGDPLSDQTTVDVLADGTLDLTGVDERFGNLRGSGTVLLAGGTALLGINGASTTFSGLIRGSGGSLVKKGAGTFTLTAANTYTGGTVIEAGTLRVTNTTGSATGSGLVTVKNGGVLGGTGGVGGGVNVLPGGTVAPGLSVGELFVSSVTFNPGSTYKVEIAGTGSGNADLLNSQGLAVLSGTLSFDRIGGFQPLPGDSFAVMQYGSRIGTFDQVVGQTGFPGLSLVPAYDVTAMFLAATALGGDANLDGVVNLQDFNVLAANFGQSGRAWQTGDFNFDGIVNLADFNILAANFGQSAAGPEVTPEDWASLSAAVPEPGGAAVVVLGVCLIARRRRNRI